MNCFEIQQEQVNNFENSFIYVKVHPFFFFTFLHNSHNLSYHISKYSSSKTVATMAIANANQTRDLITSFDWEDN
jgi:hypothetical protein